MNESSMLWGVLGALFVVVAIVRRAARRRALGFSGPAPVRPKAAPSDHAAFVSAVALVPPLLLLLLWLVFSSFLTSSFATLGASDVLTRHMALLGDDERLLFFMMADNIATAEHVATNRTIGKELLELAGRIEHVRSLLNLAGLLVIPILSVGLAIWALGRVCRDYPAARVVERIAHIGLFFCALVAVLVTLGVVFALLFDALAFFRLVPPGEFFFGLHWNPQIAFRPGEIDIEGSFGAVPLFAGVLLITSIALVFSGSIGLMTAIYLSEYARERTRSVIKPALEILAGIPTVVYGLLAVTVVAPALTGLGGVLGLPVSSESALGAGLVMGVMIIPLISSLSDDALRASSSLLREASLGLGATRCETVLRVILPAAAPGLLASLLLAASRAVGETMIVVMAAGLSANLTANPLSSVTTVTVQIVTLLVGDSSFDSPRTLAAFGLGLFLLLVTLAMNLVALLVSRYFYAKYSST